jgi:hypothetical protein
MLMVTALLALASVVSAASAQGKTFKVCETKRIRLLRFTRLRGSLCNLQPWLWLQES